MSFGPAVDGGRDDDARRPRARVERVSVAASLSRSSEEMHTENDAAVSTDEMPIGEAVSTLQMDNQAARVAVKAR